MKKAVLLFIMLFTALILGGCVEGSVDELYSLPQMQEKYQQLQALLGEEIAAGGEYSAPTTGTRRQSVQLVDINSDGAEEVFAFLKNPSYVPSIYIYRLVGGEYKLVSTITGEGTAIGRVEYDDLDGDGIMEVIVSWKMNNDMATVKAYSMKDWSSSVLFTASCTDFRVNDFGDLDEFEAGKEVAVLDMNEERSRAELYFVDSKGEISRVSAELSANLVNADRFRVSPLADGEIAMFVEGNYRQDDLVYYLTDVFVFRDGELKNITLNPETGESIAVRRVQIYCQDINGDGTLDIPFSEQVYRQTKATSDYFVYDWYTFSSDGERNISAYTYHSNSDGWYYVLPEEWRYAVTVRRDTGDSGERIIVFSTVDANTQEVLDYLTIYTLTGENRKSRARLPGRFILLQSESTIYAAKLETYNGESVTEDQKNDVIGRFHLITSEWTTGAV